MPTFAIALALASEAGAAPDGWYLDQAGRRVEHAPVYESWFGADRYEPKVLRAVLENVGMSIVEVFIYWYDPELNAADWQFPDVGEKLTTSESVRFDDNLIRTNYLHHPTAGSMHYLLTRTNGFGVVGAFTAAAASSALYELVLEWRELVSLNDLIVTPFGGLAMGEFFHQLGNYLNSEPPTVRTDVRRPVDSVARGAARFTLGFPRAVHDTIDDPDPPLAVPADDLGLSSAYGHAFRVRFGRDTVLDERERMGGLYSLSVEGEIAAMPGFQRPGNFARGFDNGNFTALDARIAFGDAGSDGSLFVDSHLAGYYGQDIRATGEGLVGQAHEVALASGLRYVSRDLLGRRDQYGTVHLPHPVARGWFHLGPARVELLADASFDFASLRSAAFETYSARFGPDGMKTSLRTNGYAHALGVSGRVEALLAAGAFELGGAARYGRYASIDGLERHEEQVTRDSHATETVADLSVHARIEPPDTILSAELELAESRRGSTLETELGTFREVRHQRRISVELGLRF